MKRTELRVTTPTSNAPANTEGLTVERLRTIVQDSHINFLFGAGTSAPYFELLGDIEVALTQLNKQLAGNPAASVAKASLQAYYFEKVLLPNILLLERAQEAQGFIKSYVRFVSILNRILLLRRSTLLGKQANIFTTNVDVAFEVALELLEIGMNDGFSGKLKPRLDLGEYGTLRIRQGTRYEYRSEIPTVNLFKIHGSVTWKQERDEIYFDHQLTQITKIKKVCESAKPSLVHIATSNDVKADSLLEAGKEKELHESVQAFISAYESLSIVNPDKEKFATTVLNKTYYELIRRLANELEKENSVLFVHGFSFRDEHLRDVLLRAASTNPTLQLIVFCYERTVRDELRLLIPDELIKNGNIFFEAPSAPTVGEIERSITLDVLVEDYLGPLLAGESNPADHVIELRLGNLAEGTDDAR